MNSKVSKKHLAVCSIPNCKQQISENCSLHVFPNERDPRRKQWIKVLKVERDVPRHFRICSKHFKSSDFFPRHQMQKKLMLRPSAVPSQFLPTESTIHVNERPESPENTSSSFISLDQSDSSTTGVTHVVTNGTTNHHLMNVNSVNNNINTINNNTIVVNQNIISNCNNSNSSSNNNIILNNNNNNNNIIHNNNLDEYHHHEDVKMTENHFTYHPAPPIQQATTPAPVNFQPTSYENFTTLSTVPYQEITPDPAYQLYDGTEIDRNRLLSVLNKDDYGDGTVTYVVNFVDY